MLSPLCEKKVKSIGLNASEPCDSINRSIGVFLSMPCFVIYLDFFSSSKSNKLFAQTKADRVCGTAGTLH